MKAYDVLARITEDGRLELPKAILKLLPRGQEVRLIILVPEKSDLEEEIDWSRLTAEQFFAGYAEMDSVYDDL